MKMFFLFLSTVFLGVTFSEGRVRRQIWPGPGNPNLFWNGPDNEFFDDADFWPGPQRFDLPFRRQTGFRDDFSDGNDLNDNGFRDNFSNGNRRNQNRRTTTTTESSETLTTTQRTIHVAPQGCTCPMTQQFNPVCGTDGNTYRNMGLLNCYKRCGNNVSQKRLGVC